MSDKELIREVAQAAANAACAEMVRDQSRTATLVEQCNYAIRQLAEDLKPITTTQAMHATKIEEHDRQLTKLTVAHEKDLTEPSANTDRIKAIAEAVYMAQLRDSRKSWKDMIPAIVGGVITAVVSAVLVAVFIEKKQAAPTAPTPAVTAPTTTTSHTGP